MGQGAQDVLDGIVCQICGCWIDDHPNIKNPPGYPRTCEDCGKGEVGKNIKIERKKSKSRKKKERKRWILQK